MKSEIHKNGCTCPYCSWIAEFIDQGPRGHRITPQVGALVHSVLQGHARMTQSEPTDGERQVALTVATIAWHASRAWAMRDWFAGAHEAFDG